MSSLLQVSESMRNSCGPNNYDCPCQEIVIIVQIMIHVKMLSSKNIIIVQIIQESMGKILSPTLLVGLEKSCKT